MNLARAETNRDQTLGKWCGVFAELGQRVEGGSPNDAALFEREEHGAKQRKDGDQGTEREEQCVPGGDAGVAAQEAVGVGNCGEGEDSGDAGGVEEESDRGGDAKDEEPEAA